MAQKQKDYHAKTRLFLFKAFHFVLTCGLFFAVWLRFRYGEILPVQDAGFRYNYLVTAGFAAILALFNRTYNSYLFGYCRIRTLALAQFLSHFFALGIVYFAVMLGWNKLRSPLLFLLLLLVYAVLDTACAYCGNWIYFRMYPPRKTVLIYRNRRDRKRFGSIKGKPMERLYRIVDELQYDGTFRDLEPYLSGYDAIFVAGVNSRCRNGILKYCKENSVRGFFLPHVGDTIMQEATHVQSFDSPVLYVNRKVLEPEYAFLKRAFDIISSGVALIILSPIMLITGLAIHFYDGGPAFYKQVRLTKDGKTFKILKFRSMRVDAEKDGVARLSTGENDDRITPIGKIVRKCRLDELPQLWNIFVGDMSVVGDRVILGHTKKKPVFMRLSVA